MSTKRNLSFSFFSLSRKTRDFIYEFYSRDHRLSSIKTRLSRDYKVTSTFLTGMFAINLRITKVYVYVCMCARVYCCRYFFFLPLFINGSNIQRRYLSISRQYITIANARSRCFKRHAYFRMLSRRKAYICHYDHR